MANIKIYTGTNTFFSPGTTPFGTYDNDTQFQADIENTTNQDIPYNTIALLYLLSQESLP